MNHETQKLGPLIERITSLHRHLLRKLAADEGLQLVHVEILQYLSICNAYSDTTQAVSEYLGQTKGSISQSLSHLEELEYIKRVQDKIDKRIFHLQLRAKGEQIAEKAMNLLNVKGSTKAESTQQHFYKLDVAVMDKVYNIGTYAKF